MCNRFEMYSPFIKAISWREEVVIYFEPVKMYSCLAILLGFYLCQTEAVKGMAGTPPPKPPPAPLLFSFPDTQPQRSLQFNRQQQVVPQQQEAPRLSQHQAFSSSFQRPQPFTGSEQQQYLLSSSNRQQHRQNAQQPQQSFISPQQQQFQTPLVGQQLPTQQRMNQGIAPTEQFSKPIINHIYRLQ